MGVPARGLEAAEFRGEFAAALGCAKVGGKFGQAVLALDNAMGGEALKLVVSGFMRDDPRLQPHRTCGTTHRASARIPHDKMGGEGKHLLLPRVNEDGPGLSHLRRARRYQSIRLREGRMRSHRLGLGTGTGLTLFGALGGATGNDATGFRRVGIG